MNKSILYCVLMIAVMSGVHAATLSGTVYDITLSKVDNVKVEIDTTPMQRDITEDGMYSFQLPKGSYVLSAVGVGGSVTEEITINTDGEFIYDLILFPEIESEIRVEEITFDGVLLGEEEEEGQQEGVASIAPPTRYGGIILAALVMLFVYLKSSIFSKKDKFTITQKGIVYDKDLEEIIGFLIKQGGRVTQKDIRKEFPSSEAKISLLLTELEAKGKIEKIKKGRGNIVVLK